MSARTSPDVDARLRRLERMGAVVFDAILGDSGQGEPERYQCPDCSGCGRHSGFECVRCGGRGTISLRQKARIDRWEIGRESAEPAMETRVR